MTAPASPAPEGAVLDFQAVREAAIDEWRLMRPQSRRSAAEGESMSTATGAEMTDPRPAPVVGFKWTNAEGRSWHDGTFGPWESGKTYSVADAEKNGPCGRGIHIGKTAAHAIGYGRFPGRLFSVRATGPVLGQDETKWRVGSVECVAELEKPDWCARTEAFIASIKTVAFFNPRQRPLKKWKHYPAWAAAWDAAWDAAWAAARDAAWAAARAAAWAAARDAAWAAARDAAWAAAGDAAGAAAWDAARAAAWAAARDAAWAAAWDAARDAAGDAAWDADLMSLIEVTSDLDFPEAEKHRKHARERWKVWQMGYGLVADVGGVFYTYGKEPK